MFKTIRELKPNSLFILRKDYEKYGDNDKYLRIKQDYDRVSKKFYCPLFTRDALGCGKSFKGDVEVYII